MHKQKETRGARGWYVSRDKQEDTGVLNFDVQKKAKEDHIDYLARMEKLVAYKLNQRDGRMKENKSKLRGQYKSASFLLQQRTSPHFRNTKTNARMISRCFQTKHTG